MSAIFSAAESESFPNEALLFLRESFDPSPSARASQGFSSTGFEGPGFEREGREREVEGREREEEGSSKEMEEIFVVVEAFEGADSVSGAMI